MLPDRDRALAATGDVHETYMRSGLGAGMAKFIALTSHKGEIPARSRLTGSSPEYFVASNRQSGTGAGGGG